MSNTNIILPGIFILGILFFSLHFTSCNSKTSEKSSEVENTKISAPSKINYELLYGEWEISEVDLSELYEELSPMLIYNVESMLLSKKTIFNKDSTFVETSESRFVNLENRNEGTYNVDKNNNTFTTNIKNVFSKKLDEENAGWQKEEDNVYYYSSTYLVLESDSSRIVTLLKNEDKNMYYTWTKIR